MCQHRHDILFEGITSDVFVHVSIEVSSFIAAQLILILLSDRAIINVICALKRALGIDGAYQ